MKNKILNGCMNYIKKNTKYDEVKLKEIRYGIEGIYLTLTKTIFILIISILLGITKYVILYILIYNIIRMPSFGLHATKSWICLLASTILFIGIPYLCIILEIPVILKSIIGGLAIFFMYKNSPADTYKRPIVSKKRREMYKFLSVMVAILYSALAILLKNNLLSNIFLLSLVMQNFMISPVTYSIFGLPYNNYIEYFKKHPEYSY